MEGSGTLPTSLWIEHPEQCSRQGVGGDSFFLKQLWQGLPPRSFTHLLVAASTSGDSDNDLPCDFGKTPVGGGVLRHIPKAPSSLLSLIHLATETATVSGQCIRGWELLGQLPLSRTLTYLLSDHLSNQNVTSQWLGLSLLCPQQLTQCPAHSIHQGDVKC